VALTAVLVSPQFLFRIESGPLAPRAETVSRSETTTLLDLYRRLLAGDVTGKEVWSQLKASNRVGVTRGTLEERRNPLAIL
jgi:putative protease